ncbi:acyl-CoA dehydrogenase [Congregibacter variabilis]|uniref:Acyl-CoA dehydrogenase n=1 Tax=Congregibacter variabilis TaxID=3081200 RepID=A0ABZ0I5Z1_9GAMM|nr:acyl-CoA dehydrogenase [Congregibacter sp. IMCC43200]
MYRAPLEDMRFVIDEVLCIGETLGSLPRFEELGVGEDLTAALLDEGGKLAGEVLAPLRRGADMQPARCEDQKVVISPGYADAIRQLAQGGWFGISADADFGGQGLPELYGTAASEMWNGADMAFALAPILSSGAALAIASHATDELKAIYLEKLHTGEWTGTMNLTESGAGSDLGVMKTRAVPNGDHYLITGQKIYITWGDHDAVDNIVHLVLAKLPDAPEGSSGISLFLVPKFLVNADGSLGERNDVYPVSTEHKLGIHGSPTCVMAFGDQGGAVGYLVGEENRGLTCMFTMMNEARLKVGLQSLGATEGSYQLALAYAKDRVQGGVPIIEHADVKRMLLTMKALSEGMRALAYSEAVTMDLAHYGADAQRSMAQARIDLMIPVIKGWMTEVGVELTSLGVQVHGGMGYVEETGAAQYLRDVRITPIYEGTNGIQAADLVGRKLGRDGGSTMAAVLDMIRADAQDYLSRGGSLEIIGQCLLKAVAQQAESTEVILQMLSSNPEVAGAAAFDYMMQTGFLFGAWQLARGAAVAQAALKAGSDNEFYARKVATATFYAQSILPRCEGYAGSVANAGGALQDYPVGWL